ncbi:MAG: hypothetical protein ACYS22_11085, partial [Planctomycetota bacterium]
MARFGSGADERILKPSRDDEGAITGYELQQGGQTVQTLTAAAAAELAQANGATAAILGEDG